VSDGDHKPVDNLPVATPGTAFRLLEGIRVVDLTNSIAGPYATMLLGDFGAEIIKVERPGRGDDARHWGPPFIDGQSPWFQSVNRNKRSVTLDYASEKGRLVLHDLVGRSDVLITNLVPRVQEKLGVDYTSMQAVRENLIFVSLTGFGVEGERRDQLCYDLIAEGYSGVMDLTGTADSEPQKVGTPAADLLAGMDAAMAAMAALNDRARTGKGHLIDIALVDSMTRFMTPRIAPYLATGTVPRRSGAKDSVIAVYQTFETADGPITLALGNDVIWGRFWEAVGDAGYGARFPTNGERVAARPEIVAKIAAMLAEKPRSHWLDLLAAAKVPAGPINRVDEVAADAELQRRGLFFAIESEGTPIPQVGLGIGVDGQAAGYDCAPPRLGADTEDVLIGLLGYDAEAVAELKEQGIL